MISLAELKEGLTPEAVGYGVLLPGALTAGVLAAALRLPARAARHGGLAAAAALAAGVCAGYFALGLGPPFPAESGNTWLPHLTLLAIPAGWAAGIGRPRRLVLTALALTGVVTAFALEPGSWNLRLFWAAVFGYAILVTASSLIYSPVPGAMTALAMALVSAAASLLLLAAGLARMTQLAGVLFACCGAAAVILGVFDRDPEKRLARGLAPGFAALLAGLMFSGYLGQGADIPSWYYVAAALAPAALFVTRLGPVGRRRTLVAFTALAAPLAAVVLRAVLI